MRPAHFGRTPIEQGRFHSRALIPPNLRAGSVAGLGQSGLNVLRAENPNFSPEIQVEPPQSHSTVRLTQHLAPRRTDTR
jgi:hypothetical protein